MPNDLVCFTNCLLPQEDGSLIEKDLWVDARRGVILDAQVGLTHFRVAKFLTSATENFLPEETAARHHRRSGGEYPQVWHIASCFANRLS